MFSIQNKAIAMGTSFETPKFYARKKKNGKKGGKNSILEEAERQSRVPQGSKNGSTSTDAKEDKTGDRKKREFKQSRGHNRRTLATKKASRGMLMTSWVILAIIFR